MLRSADNGLSWSPFGVPPAADSVLALVAHGNRLYTGGSGGSSGTAQAWSSAMDRAEWVGLPTLPDGAASVSTLAYVEGHGLLAGMDVGSGPATTQVYHLQDDGSWVPFRGELDLATAVYDLIVDADRVWAATGYVYGNVYAVRSASERTIFLPMIHGP